jgi:hypothetical protein
VLGEDGQRVDLPLATVLLTLAATPVVAEQGAWRSGRCARIASATLTALTTLLNPPARAGRTQSRLTTSQRSV